MPRNNRTVWLEKFRPESLDDIKGQEANIESIKRYVDRTEITNMLFAGPPGVGKTATAVAIAREIYGDNWENNFLELNASDDRGIDIIREDVKNFAKSSTKSASFRLIFLDESDSLTKDAQSALRRTMEIFSSNVRFILSCNYSSQIIEPIQSRCTVYRFTKLSDDAIRNQLEEIIEVEDLSITKDAVNALVYSADGDMRRGINGLQAVRLFDGEATEEDVYTITNTVRPEEIEDVIEKAVGGQFVAARSKAHNLMDNNGVAATQFLEQTYRFIWDSTSIEGETAVSITGSISEADYRITQGANPRIQVDSFLSELSELDTANV